MTRSCRRVRGSWLGLFFDGWRWCLAVLCFLFARLSGLFGLFLDDGNWFFVGLCVWVGFLMTFAVSTGAAPIRRRPNTDCPAKLRHYRR